MLPGIVPAVGIFPCRGFLIPCHITGSCSVRFFMSSSFLFLVAALLSKNRPRQTGRFAPAWLAGLLPFSRFLRICFLLLRRSVQRICHGVWLFYPIPHYQTFVLLSMYIPLRILYKSMKPSHHRAQAVSYTRPQSMGYT